MATGYCLIPFWWNLVFIILWTNHEILLICMYWDTNFLNLLFIIRKLYICSSFLFWCSTSMATTITHLQYIWSFLQHFYQSKDKHVFHLFSQCETKKNKGLFNSSKFSVLGKQDSVQTPCSRHQSTLKALPASLASTLKMLHFARQCFHKSPFSKDKRSWQAMISTARRLVSLFFDPMS